jgi:hypothetical protein
MLSRGLPWHSGHVYAASLDQEIGEVFGKLAQARHGQRNFSPGHCERGSLGEAPRSA